MRSLLLPLAMAALLVPQIGHPCGAFIPQNQEDEVIDMTSQRTLIVMNGKQVSFYAQVSYSGNAQAFSWVYPLPGVPEVAEADGAIFEELDSMTRPVVHYDPCDNDGGNTFMCAGAASDGSKGALGIEDTRNWQDVTVWDSGQVGIFDYEVISGTTAQALLDWLEKNAYVLPDDSMPAVQHYVDNKWFFLAMKVSPQELGVDKFDPIIKMSFEAEKVEYPVVMSSISALEEMGIILYIIADRPVRSANFDNLRIEADDLIFYGWEGESNYEDVFKQRAASGAGHNFVVEFTDQIVEEQFTSEELGAEIKVIYDQFDEQPYLTRLRTVLKKENLDADVLLETLPEADEPELVDNNIYIAKDCPEDDEGCSIGSWLSTHRPVMLALILLFMLALPLAMLKRFSR